MNIYYIYIMANKYRNVLYIGMTNDLKRRVYEHKNDIIDGYTKQYRCKKLVWYEQTNNVQSAILKEKRMKKWKREFKEYVINEMNPEWNDLYENII